MSYGTLHSYKLVFGYGDNKYLVKYKSIFSDVDISENDLH